MTRAIIERKVDEYHYTVRIPSINKIEGAVGATPTSELAIATVAAIPGISPKFRSGDIVFIEFENSNSNKPVIIGRLFNSTSSNIFSDFLTDNLEVTVNAKLPEDTQIGEVSADNIKYLTGLSNNVQTSFEKNTTEHNRLLSMHGELAEEVNTINVDLREEIKDVSGRISQLEKMSNPLKVTNASYGTGDPPSGASEGQIYFKIK